MTDSVAAPEIVVRAVLWRRLALFAAAVVLGAFLGWLLLSVLGDTMSLSRSLSSAVLGGFVGCLAVAVVQRRSYAIVLTAQELRAPGRGGGRLERADVDPVASGQSSTLDVILRRRVIRGRSGAHLNLSLWCFAPRDVARIEQALGVVVQRHDGSGV